MRRKSVVGLGGERNTSLQWVPQAQGPAEGRQVPAEVGFENQRGLALQVLIISGA